MKVRIAFATKSDGTVDVDRIGSVEDHPDADAKQLIKDGIAAAATDQDVADWESTEAHRRQVAAAEAAGIDLNTLTMDELREQYPAAAEQPSSAKKADLVAAVEDALGGDAAPADAGETDAQPDASPRKVRRNRVSGHLEDDGPAEAPIVTVAPGAESSPDVDPADRDK